MTPYLLLFWACVASGIAIPVPEDISLVAAGTQARGGELSLLHAGLVAFPAILLRDSIFFGIGRVVGDRVFTHKWALRIIGEKRLTRARDTVARRGAVAVLIGRMSIGFRSAAFLVAGAMGVRTRGFLLWDVIGLVVTIPAALLLGFVLPV